MVLEGNDFKQPALTLHELTMAGTAVPEVGVV
jgi:hypothetical protein